MKVSLMSVGVSALFLVLVFLRGQTYKRWSDLSPMILKQNCNEELVYNLRTQKLKFVAPMPEQIGTTTMHFPEGSGGPY